MPDQNFSGVEILVNKRFFGLVLCICVAIGKFYKVSKQAKNSPWTAPQWCRPGGIFEV
jgi:hypothetical protein